MTPPEPRRNQATWTSALDSSGSRTLCGRCGHGMHWHECGATLWPAGDLCACRNDEPDREHLELVPSWHDPLVRFREQPRRSCSVFTLAAFAVGLAFWLAVVLVVSAVATPRSALPAFGAPPSPGTLGLTAESGERSGAPLRAFVDRTWVPRVEESGTTSPAGLGSVPESATGSGQLGGAPPLTPEVLAGGTTYSGKLAWASPRFGPRYLALREPRGTRVLVCGPADCVEMTSNDYGPVYSLWKQGRIADVAVASWERICGVSRRFGLCPGSIQILSRPQIALPATSTKEGE